MTEVLKKIYIQRISDVEKAQEELMEKARRSRKD